jgi:hypothetical protein
MGEHTGHCPAARTRLKQQARADVAHIHEQARRSIRRGVLAEENMRG